MEFKVPFTFSDLEVLKRRSKSFRINLRPKKTKLDDYLKNTGKTIDRTEYLSICSRSFVVNMVIFSSIMTTMMLFFGSEYFYLQGVSFAILISGFIYFNQRNYPKIFSVHKGKDIEKNLIAALQDMLVQMNSGVPVFRIMVNIAYSDYGEVSGEFLKIINEINSGTSQIEAIEKSGETNTSEYFRRVLWQFGNGLRAGSDMAIVTRESIRNLSDEQAIQIQSYGSTLNPLVMFYMLVAVIIPSLGITFLIIVFSMLSIPKSIIQLIFGLVFGGVVLMQIMFLGVIKSRRPSLL